MDHVSDDKLTEPLIWVPEERKYSIRRYHIQHLEPL